MIRVHPSLAATIACAVTLSGCGVWDSAIDSLGITPMPGVEAVDPFAGSTPIVGMGIPTKAPPARIGVEVTAGRLAIQVTEVHRHADAFVNRASSHPVPEPGEDFTLVGISVRCLSSSADTCYITEFDFGITAASGRDYPPEFSSSFSGLTGLFEGGGIQPGDSMAGSLIFIMPQTETGLTLKYPRLLPLPGSSASFLLDP